MVGIKQVGSAVFSRNGTLLGIISGVEKYEYDAGRRAIVKSLLGMPRLRSVLLSWPILRRTPAPGLVHNNRACQIYEPQPIGFIGFKSGRSR